MQPMLMSLLTVLLLLPLVRSSFIDDPRDSWCFDRVLKFLWLSLSIIIHLPRWDDTSGYHGFNLLFTGLQRDDVVHKAMLAFIDKYSYSFCFLLCILDLPR